jgi:sulfatase maturation enzyme AslB (radical SAM superfamily)
MAGLERIRYLSVILTSRCNLRCGYCYQNDKKPGSMSWETLAESLDLMLGSGRKEIEVSFLGGEPLLEFPMIQRAVEYMEVNRDRLGKEASYWISTNGTLITPGVADFLAMHHFDTQLSFDGLARAQDGRRIGSFDHLDGLLDAFRDRHPDFYENYLTIAMTVTPANIVSLAGSIDYFLGKGIKNISMAPSIIHYPDWRPERIAELETQYEMILRSSLDHLGRTGEVPLLIFRDNFEDRRCAAKELEMCGIAHGANLVVDVDGQTYGCAVHARSYQRFEQPFLSDCMERLRIGPIGSDEFAERIESFPEAVRSTGLFHNKEKKRSSYSRCADCSYVAQCSVCPVSIGHIPDSSDPDLVPSFVCAVSLAMLRCRDRFPRKLDPRRPFSIPDEVSKEMERWKVLAETMRG